MTDVDRRDAMQCLSEENAVVLAYWTGKAGSRRMPARGDLDPILDLRELSQYLFLLDVSDGGTRFRFRLVGTGLVDCLGKDITGADLDDLAHGARHFAQMKQQCEATIRAENPVRGTFCLPSEYTDHHAPFEQLLLPLSDDGHSVNMLLGTFNPPSDETSEANPEVVLLQGKESRAGDAVIKNQSRP